jgi:hypothetical protein
MKTLTKKMVNPKKYWAMSANNIDLQPLHGILNRNGRDKDNRFDLMC